MGFWDDDDFFDDTGKCPYYGTGYSMGDTTCSTCGEKRTCRELSRNRAYDSRRNSVVINDKTRTEITKNYDFGERIRRSNMELLTGRAFLRSTEVLLDEIGNCIREYRKRQF